MGTATSHLGAHGQGLTYSFLPQLLSDRWVLSLVGARGVVSRMTEQDVPDLLPEDGRRHTEEGALQGWLLGTLRQEGATGILGAPRQ